MMADEIELLVELMTDLNLEINEEFGLRTVLLLANVGSSMSCSGCLLLRPKTCRAVGL